MYKITGRVGEWVEYMGGLLIWVQEHVVTEVNEWVDVYITGQPSGRIVVEDGRWMKVCLDTEVDEGIENVTKLMARERDRQAGKQTGM